MIKVKKAVEDIRRLAGYSFSGSSVNSANILVNDNLVINSINDTVKSMSINQYRPFLNTISLNHSDMIGNDLYRLSNVYGWYSSLSSSKTPVSDLLQVPQDKQVSRVNFWYDSRSENGSTSLIFRNNMFVYNPNEYEKYIGTLYTVKTFILGPLQRIYFHSNHINTYKMEFIIKIGDRFIDRFTPVLNESVAISHYSTAGIYISINYEDMRISLMHQSPGGSNVFNIEFNTYTAYNSNCFLMYEGKIREIGARNINRYSKQVQAYIIPYFVVDITQNIPREVSGELYELFIFESALHLQKELRSVDTDLLDILKDIRIEYYNKLSLEKISKNIIYPSSF